MGWKTQLPKYISADFGSLDKPWKPGYLRSAYGWAAVCFADFFIVLFLATALLALTLCLTVSLWMTFYLDVC